MNLDSCNIADALLQILCQIVDVKKSEQKYYQEVVWSQMVAKWTTFSL